MLSIGGLKAAAKRTAFNEKSNVSKDLTKASEVSIIGNKVESDKADKVEQVEKVTIKESDIAKDTLVEKPAALLRPAQRPLNGNGKTTLNAAAPPYIPSAIPFLPIQQAVKRNNSKKAPIYIDNAMPVEQAVTYPTNEAVNDGPKEAIVVPAPLHLNVGPRQHKSQPELKPEQPILRRTQSRSLDGAAPEFQVGAPIAIPHVLPPLPALPALPSYQHVSEQQHKGIGHGHGHGVQPTTSFQLKMDEALVAEYLEDEEPKIVRDAATRTQQEKILAGATEPEEYSEEDSEEFYDEHGYTTGYSFRSRGGDNTTGGVTQVIVPRWNKKICEELDAAKTTTIDNRPQEEVEDEAWDTSMVAEYGDEIFQYMRELEVCPAIPLYHLVMV